jgi:hypothetical protein
MIENALGVLDVALAAAEPGRGASYFVPSKGRGELVLVTTPDGNAGQYRAFIDLVIDKESGTRADPAVFLDVQQGVSWFRVDGYSVVNDKEILELFNGSLAALEGDVETWDVAYNPNGGSNKHVPEMQEAAFEVAKNKPGAVVAPAILAIKLKKTKFNRVIGKHLTEFWANNPHLTFEYKRDDRYLVRYLYQGKPKFTEKVAESLRQKAAAESPEFLSLCRDYLQQMRAFSARTARVAYKFNDE